MKEQEVRGVMCSKEISTGHKEITSYTESGEALGGAQRGCGVCVLGAIQLTLDNVLSDLVQL